MKSPSPPHSAPVTDFASLPVEYGALCRDVLLPRPIRDRAHYRETVAVADALAGHRLTRDQADYFSLLCDLIESWDREHQSPPPAGIPPLDVLRHLMEEHGLASADLARILEVSPSLASRILHGERQFTTRHITTLARHFGIGPAAFLPVD